MQARLKTSLKWTAFPKEYLEKIHEVFASTFADQLEAGESFSIEGRIYPEEVLMRIGIKQEGRLSQPNFETSVQFNPEKQDAIEQIYLSIDALASMIEQYFHALIQEETLDFPRSWTEFDFSGKKLHLQFTTVNPDLEAQANALLGLNEEELVNEQQALDALDFAEIDSELSEETEDDFAEDLDAEEEEDADDIDTSKPSLFSNKLKH